MSIEEKAKEKSPYTENTWQEGYNIWESGFKSGAELVFKKAVTWLSEQCIDEHLYRELAVISIDEFKKAMGE